MSQYTYHYYYYYYYLPFETLNQLKLRREKLILQVALVRVEIAKPKYVRKTTRRAKSSASIKRRSAVSAEAVEARDMLSCSKM
jgi:hypothetical protein